ncbi:MAG TPA: VTT domain-containing protein [Gemmatimonadales bacterium]|nr:VTT domain-containing protein [Gemmatimonadales bacterium]
MKLLAFFLLAVVVHGPLSPFLPTAFEATLLYYVRFYPALLLAVVGTVGASLAEAINYYLVDWAAELPKLAELKKRPAVRWSIRAFLRAPFWTTVIVIFSPIPDSAVRILAPLGRYPLPRFLAAVALGRFPRLLLIAGFGVLVPMPAWVLLGAGLILVAIAVGRRHAAIGIGWLRRRWD